MVDGDLPVTVHNAAGQEVYSGPLGQARDHDFLRARALVVGAGSADRAELQRGLGIGYADAETLLKRLELAGVVSPPHADTGRRRVLAAFIDLKEDAPERRIFTDQDQLLAAAGDASNFLAGLLSHADAPENDAEVRELTCSGVEAILYAFTQLREPDALERRLITHLAMWADGYADRTCRSSRLLTGLVARMGA